MTVYDDNSLSIGKTPLIKIRNMNKGSKANIYAKIEGRNPAYSVKCRIGANMIWEAEKSGQLKPGGKIIEPTSGNTGIALAFVAASRGYELTVTMPESMSMERRKALSAMGAKIVLTPAADGMKGALAKAAEIAKEPGYFMPAQFENPANPAIHQKTTGPEIDADLEGKIDILIAGVGTGGTITGISRYFKKDQGKQITSIAVEPAESPIITQKMAGEELQPNPHKIQGIGAGFIPQNLDLDMVDAVELVSSEEAIDYARKLTKEEGIFSGISCGAAICAALRVAAREENAGKNIVVILPDSGERYLSSALFADVFDEAGMAV
ncbi:MAG: cysteine synthase A [Candidatus Omnitrophota bacterium]|jgi:cysteine synthase A